MKEILNITIGNWSDTRFTTPEGINIFDAELTPHLNNACSPYTTKMDKAKLVIMSDEEYKRLNPQTIEEIFPEWFPYRIRIIEYLQSKGVSKPEDLHKALEGEPVFRKIIIGMAGVYGIKI